ncbi:dentin sialophosphoprotein-like isoform X2 [Ptychodera flava]|uniref:dentin sialophosphoprotein-like isoform X2 n=1 Tax=Ptychodera flava TaxID=63121 RepID=UPI003969F21F
MMAHDDVMMEHDKAMVAHSEVMASHDRAMVAHDRAVVAHDKVTTAHGNRALDDTLEDATMMSVDESEEPEDDDDGCQKLPDGERETNKTLLKSTPESQTDVSTISSLQASMSTEKSKGDGNKPGGRCNSSSQNTEENRCDSTPQTSSDNAQIKSEPVANVTEPDLMTSGQSFKEGAPSSPLPDTLILDDDSSFSSTSQLCSGTELVEGQQLKTKQEPLDSPKVEHRDVSPDNVEHESQPLDFEGETLSYNFSLSNPIEENEYTQQDSDETQVDSATSLNAQKPDKDGQSEQAATSSSPPSQLTLSDECAKITDQESLNIATNADTSTTQNLSSGNSAPSTSNHSAIKNSTAGHLGDPSMETAIDLTDSQESEIDLTKSLSDSQESLYVYDGDDIVPVTASQSDDIITKSDNGDDIIMVTGPGCSNSKKGSGTISVSASQHKNRGKVNDIIPVTASQRGKTGKPTCGKVNDEDSVFSLISAPEENSPSVLETTVPQDNRVGVVTPTRRKRSSDGSQRGRKGSGSTEKPGTDAIMVVEDAEFAKVLQLSKQEYEKNQQKPGAEKHGIDCTDSGDLTEPSRQCLTDEEFARLLQRQFELEVNHTGTTLQTRSTTSDGVQWQEIIDAAARKDTSRFDSRSTTPNTGSRRRHPTPTKRSGSIETDLALVAKKRKTEEEKDFEIAMRYHSIINNKGSDDSGTRELGKQKTQNKPTPSKLSAINQQKQIAEYRKQMQEQYKHRHPNNTPQKSASPHSSALGNPSTLPSRSSDWSSQTRPSAAVLPRTSTSRISSLTGSLAMSSTHKPTASSASTSSQKHSTPSAAVSSTSGIWSLSHTVPAAAINLSDDDDDDDDFPDLSDRMRKK